MPRATSRMTPRATHSVFLDEAGPTNKDFTMLGIQAGETWEYYAAMKAQFPPGLSVAKHPSDTLAHYKATWGAYASQEDTLSLIRQADHVYAHASTAVNMAVILGKPVTILDVPTVPANHPWQRRTRAVRAALARSDYYDRYIKHAGPERPSWIPLHAVVPRCHLTVVSGAPMTARDVRRFHLSGWKSFDWQTDAERIELTYTGDHVLINRPWSWRMLRQWRAVSRLPEPVIWVRTTVIPDMEEPWGRRVLKWLWMQIPCWLLGVRPVDVVWLSGTAALESARPLISKDTKLVWAHCQDYDKVRGWT